MKPEMAVLRGRLAEALGHDKDAIDAYRFAAYSSDRQASAEAKLLGSLLSHKRGELGQAELLRELETLSAIWRGDNIELMTLNRMVQIYADTGRASIAETSRSRGSVQPSSCSRRMSVTAAPSDLGTSKRLW